MTCFVHCRLIGDVYMYILLLFTSGYRFISLVSLVGWSDNVILLSFLPTNAFIALGSIHDVLSPVFREQNQRTDVELVCYVCCFSEQFCNLSCYVTVVLNSFVFEITTPVFCYINPGDHTEVIADDSRIL